MIIMIDDVLIAKIDEFYGQNLILGYRGVSKFIGPFRCREKLLFVFNG